MNELAVKSANETNQTEDQSKVDAPIKEIDCVAQAMTFNEKQHLDGSWRGGIGLKVGSEGISGSRVSVSIKPIYTMENSVDKLPISGAVSQTVAENPISTIKAIMMAISKQCSDLGAIRDRLEHIVNNLDNVMEDTTGTESQNRATDRKRW